MSNDPEVAEAAPLTITIESNAIDTVGGWRPGIKELLELNEGCPAIDVRRTAGTRRERSKPAGDPDAAERRRLAMTVEPLVEAFTWGVSEYGDDESLLAGTGEPDDMGAISLALWGRSASELSDLSDMEDVVHLQTHYRHGRDLFVTTDRRMLARRAALDRLGVQVRSPREALDEARQACE